MAKVQTTPPESIKVHTGTAWADATLETVKPGETKAIKVVGPPKPTLAIVNGQPVIGELFKAEVSTVETSGSSAVPSNPSLSGMTVFSSGATSSESLVRQLNPAASPGDLVSLLGAISTRLDDGLFFFGARAAAVLEQRLEDLRGHESAAVSKLSEQLSRKLAGLESIINN